MKPLILAATLAVAGAASAQAQFVTVQPTTPGHAMVWTPNGVYSSAGTGPVQQLTPMSQPWQPPAPGPIAPGLPLNFQIGPQPNWGR